ncbi:nucleolar protein 11 [Pectinophora gossypiella]|uniref:nucleolar protein 11 n=1 Tax=Pectinophora gossypiella TaxID=13191 RepID=UPI00214E4D4F|nr:nucleolar protein 11 [Pectinophora gossypiella]
MAKLHNYHVLCPLIDQKSFLGVSQDKEEEYVIVTLGRNVVNKYRLSDQKQVGGWTSRDHITSAVIYDKEQESYVGIFNNNTIKTWKNSAENLDKIKKHKFSTNMLKLIPRGHKASLIVFSNGNCASLPYAIDNRKTYDSKSFIKESELIIDTSCYSDNGTDYVCYVIKNNKDLYEIVNCPVREELGDMEKSKLNRVKVTRPDDVYIVGELICTSEKYLSVYVLWSDAKLTVYDLANKSWKTIGTVPWISTLSKVSIAWMGKQHLVLIGSNTDQDGAIMVAYNVSLGVGSCKYPMKMYSEGAKLYCFNSRIILEAPNHIGMLPYVLETRRNLSSLLGSHEIIQDECTEIANWETSSAPQFNVANEIKEHLKLGVTERTICSQVITPLLEKHNINRILTLLKEFKDIPESILVQLLNYTIKFIKPNEVDITNHAEIVKFCSHKESSGNESLKLLNYILELTFSDALLIPYLRNGLALNDTLFLMSYITYLLVDSEVSISADYESKLLDWCTLLMDSFYQQYLMTKDEKVTYVLQNTLNVVVNLIKQLGVIDTTMCKLNKFLSGNSNMNEDTLSYSIEMMQI